jgi:transcriptional regulator with XRE-family HTH domain
MGTIRENIARNIKKYREAHGYSQRELAKKLGVGYSSVSNWELGLNSPNVELLVQMCDLFDIKIATMYGISEEAERKARRMFDAYERSPDSIKRVVDTALELNLSILEQQDQQEDNEQ